MGDLRVFLRYGIVGYMMVFFDIIFICSFFEPYNVLKNLNNIQGGIIIAIMGLPLGWLCYQVWDQYMNIFLIPKSHNILKIRGLEVDDEFSRPEFRLTLDNEKDYELLIAIYERFYEDGIPVDIREVFKFLDDNPELANINRFSHVKEINWYVEGLGDKPVFSIFQSRTGKHIVKNRMEEIISYDEFQKALREIQWEKM